MTKLNSIGFKPPSEIKTEKLRNHIDELFKILVIETDQQVISKTIPLLQSYQVELDLRASEVSDKSSRRFAGWSLTLVIFSIIPSLISAYYAYSGNKLDVSKKGDEKKIILEKNYHNIIAKVNNNNSLLQSISKQLETKISKEVKKNNRHP